MSLKNRTQVNRMADGIHSVTLPITMNLPGIFRLMQGIALLAAICIAPSQAQQGRRIALVIGNGSYIYSDRLPKLANPTNDAQDIAAALRGFGFEVIERTNLTLEGMNQSIAEFGSKIGGSEAALFYFAGHGLQVKNQNFLMPVSAKVESEAVIPYQGLNMNQVLDEMDNGNSGINIVILDACRNNPISGKFRSGNSRGLASPGSSPRATVIVYATDPGNVASDGEGRNGLFTAGLLTAFSGNNLSLDEVLTVASAEVEHNSGHTQSPYVNGPKTVQKNFYFRGRSTTGQLQVHASSPGAPVSEQKLGTTVSTPLVEHPLGKIPRQPSGSDRCAQLLSKSSLGEPLSATEKQEMSKSCR